MTLYAQEQADAYTELKAAGVLFACAFEPNDNFDPVSGRTVDEDQPYTINTYGIFKSVTSKIRQTVPEELIERISTGALIAAKPFSDAGREIETSAQLTVSDKVYRILGFGVTNPDGASIIYELALEEY